MPRRRLAALLTISAVALAACQSTQSAAPPENDPERLTGAQREALENLQTSDRLNDFADYFRSTVSSVGNEVLNSTTDLPTRAAVRYWQLRLIPTMYEIINQPNARAATVDVLIFCIQTREWIEAQENPIAEASARERALEAHRQFEERARTLVRETVKPENLERVEEFIDTWVAENKLAGIDSRARATKLTAYRYENPYQALTGTGGMFGSLQTGLGDTTFELRRLRHELRRMNEMLDMAPTYARWSAEILIYDLMGSPYGRSLIDSLEETGDGFTRLNDTLADLALRVEQQIPQLRDELEKAQGPLTDAARNLNESMAMVADMLDDADRLANQAETLVARLDDAGKTWTLTANAASELIAQLPNQPDNEQELDLEGIGVLLDKLILASETNHSLITELRLLTDPAETENQIDRIDAIILRIGTNARAFLRTAALYAAGVLILGAALLFVVLRYAARRP